MYTTPTCVYCKSAKEFFTQNKVAFIEKDVVVDLQARDAMVKKSGQLGVPVIDVDGNIVIGFDRRKLEKLLEINK